MSYTKYINNNSCDYLDAQTQTADNMLLSIVNEKCKEDKNISIINQSSINPNGLDKLEGFTNGGFSGNLSGECKLKNGECPVGHTFDGKGCRQVCTHCTYRDNEPHSRSINEADICEPDGMFNGFDENGYIKCLKKNNTDEFYPLDFYSANALLVTRNPIHLVNSTRMY